MKIRTLSPIVTVILLIVVMAACRKSLDASVPEDIAIVAKDTTATIAYPLRVQTRCPNAPDYGDSIIYIQPSSTDYIVTPINHPDTGTYFSWPQGLSLDRNTGAINVTKSEGGLRYNIGYIKKGTTDTCLQQLLLAGVSYQDSLYVLNDNQRYAYPYFNADPNLSSICSSSGPGSGKCKFDINDLAQKQHIVIKKETGVIDLAGTAAKAFGPIPFNGATVTTTMAYQLDDNSMLATQQITIQFIYYNKKSDVPADLLSLVQDKLNKIVSGILLINLPGASSQQIKGNPRPPIIVVTRSSL